MKKYCAGCEEHKDLKHFGNETNVRDGLEDKCKGCKSIAASKRTSDAESVRKRRTNEEFKEFKEMMGEEI